MARVTVEDCVDKVPNRFDLVMLAAHRAREITAGSPATVDRDNDKNPVVALREIAEETQPVGQLDQDHPQVARHGHEQLAEVLGLLGLRRGQFQVGQLGDAIDQVGDLGPECLGQVLLGGPGILDRVMQKRGDDGRVVQPHFRQDGGNGDGMGEVRLARMAELAFVHPHPVFVGVADQAGIAARVVVADKRDKVFDVDHSWPKTPVPVALTLVRFQHHAQHPFLGFLVDGLGTIHLGAQQQGHGVFFRLIDLDLGLGRFDHPFAQVVNGLRFLGDLAQGDDRVLVVVAIDRGRAACGNLTGAMRGQHHQIKAVRDFVDAVFNRYAGHVSPVQLRIRVPGRNRGCERQG